ARSIFWSTPTRTPRCRLLGLILTHTISRRTRNKLNCGPFRPMSTRWMHWWRIVWKTNF
ncbi:hypothetical protein H4R35_005295, partial [Dimargaris xerosporica]